MASYEDRQNELNSHREEDRARATEVAYAQLRQRAINVTGDESSDELATLLAAVERFEEAVSSIGGDRMIHSLDTDQPDDRALVLPQHRRGEPLAEYTQRVFDAADAVLARRGAEPS